MAGESAFIIVPEAPAGLDFGIDCMQYETGPRFKGLSLVPPGLHFLHHGTGTGDNNNNDNKNQTLFDFIFSFSVLLPFPTSTLIT